MKGIDFKQLKQEIIELSGDLLELTTTLLSGGKVDLVRYRVNLEVPKPVSQFVEKVARKLSIDIDDVLSKMASDGLQATLKDVVGAGNIVKEKPQEDNILKELGVDLTGIMSQLGKLGNLAEQLQGIEKVVTDAGFTNQRQTSGDPVERSGEPHDTTPESKKNPD